MRDDRSVYHTHVAHIGFGGLMALVYASFVLIAVPATSFVQSGSTRRDVLIGWLLLSLIYYWRKGKMITAFIDRKTILSGNAGKWIIFLLFVPYAAVVVDTIMWALGWFKFRWVEWIILGGTVTVTTTALDVFSSFTTDLLKASPIAERGEIDLPPRQ